jgi:hypothetical protein
MNIADHLAQGFDTAILHSLLQMRFALQPILREGFARLKGGKVVA